MGELGTFTAQTQDRYLQLVFLHCCWLAAHRLMDLILSDRTDYAMVMHQSGVTTMMVMKMISLLMSFCLLGHMMVQTATTTTTEVVDHHQLLIVVPSSPHMRSQRSVIRDTWANPTNMAIRYHPPTCPPSHPSIQT
jgi:hypothetical protein